jgi:hypothetical protein
MRMTMRHRAVLTETSGIGSYNIVPSLVVSRVCATNHPVNLDELARNVIGASEKMNAAEHGSTKTQGMRRLQRRQSAAARDASVVVANDVAQGSCFQVSRDHRATTGPSLRRKAGYRRDNGGRRRRRRAFLASLPG